MGFFGSAIGGGLGSALGGAAGSLIGEKNAGSAIGGALGRIGGGLLPFKNGGKVPGKRGKPVKAMLHGGEVVLPVGVKPTKKQIDAIRKKGGNM